MKTKLISLLLLVTLVSSLLVGCSLGRGNTDTGGESGGDVYPTLDLFSITYQKKPRMPRLKL